MVYGASFSCTSSPAHASWLVLGDSSIPWHSVELRMVLYPHVRLCVLQHMHINKVHNFANTGECMCKVGVISCFKENIAAAA
jgi:hypothetical protein